MSRSRSGLLVIRRAFGRLGAILMVSALGLIGMGVVFPAAVANAKELSGHPINAHQLAPYLLKPMLSASAATPTVKTVTATYSCDFSKYGTGITAATMTADFKYPDSSPVNQPLTVELDAGPVSLPSQVISQLTGINSITVDSQVTVKGATATTVTTEGATTSALLSKVTSIPQLMADAEVTFSAEGTADLELPAPTIVFTPMAGTTSAPTADPVITCTTQTAATDAPVTVGTATTPTQETVTATYSCDFSKYGTGITAATMTGTFTYLDSWPVNQPMEVDLATTGVSLPSQVTSQLTGVNSITVESDVAVKGETAPVSVKGATTDTLPSSVTSIPALTAFADVTFSATGTADLELPAPTIVFTPMAGTTSAPTADPVITCTTQTAATDAPVMVTAAFGPFYNCVLTGSSGVSASGTADGFFDMTVTESGTKQVGNTVTVTLSSDAIAASIVGLNELGQAGGVQFTNATVNSTMAVTGPQPGTLNPSAMVTDLTATTFSASESLKLTKKGTTEVDIPSAWRVDLFQNTTQLVDFACTLVTTPSPVGLTMQVASSSGGSQSDDTDDEGTTTGSGGTTEATGTTPAGAPATGGGRVPGADVPLAIGGLVIVLAGGVLVARGAARRRAHG